jgi:hypothetical protein
MMAHLRFAFLLALLAASPEVLAEHRAAAAAAQSRRPRGRAGAIVVVLIWLAAVALAGWLCYRFFMG